MLDLSGIQKSCKPRSQHFTSKNLRFKFFATTSKAADIGMLPQLQQWIIISSVSVHREILNASKVRRLGDEKVGISRNCVPDGIVADMLSRFIEQNTARLETDGAQNVERNMHFYCRLQ